jgi:hypothetical protein
MTLDVYLYAIDERIERVIELPSEKNPYHLFKVGHFRSRHKPEGFNRYMKKACGETLMSVFEPPRGILRDAKISSPRPPINWPRAKERIREVRQKFEEWAKGSEKMVFYQQALEIIEETIDYVLGRTGDGKDYRLCWQEYPEAWDKFYQ